MTQPLLQFSGVDFRYPQSTRTVLQNFDLSINQGSIAAILGPNGAGKTTLLRLALGIHKPLKGDVLFEGQSISHLSRQESGRKIGFVPQKENNPFEYSLLEYVLLGRAPYLPPLGLPGKEDYEIAHDSLKRVGIEHLKHRSVLNISGGEFQLVLIARALTQQPCLLILDEPTSHLDIGNKGHLADLLRKLNSQGVTIVMSTHEPDFVSALATDLVLMRDGQVQQTGTFDEGFTTESLSALYGYPVEVVTVHGHKTALWSPR